MSCCCGRQEFGARQHGTTCTVWRKLLDSYRTRSATLPLSEPLPTTTTGHYTICCKKPQSCAPEDGQTFAPKHVELILEINKNCYCCISLVSILHYLLWTLLVTSCIVIIRCTETFWSSCSTVILLITSFVSSLRTACEVKKTCDVKTDFPSLPVLQILTGSRGQSIPPKNTRQNNSQQ